jgi:hypothetical protein
VFERAAVIQPCVCNWIFERKECHANPSVNHGPGCVTGMPFRVRGYCANTDGSGGRTRRQYIREKDL